MTLQSLRARREERKRRRRDRRARVSRMGGSRIAGTLANPVQQTVEPSVNPFIPPEQQAAFQAQQTERRTASTPFGVGVDVGAETGARDERGRPEFSGFASGFRENIVHHGLPALENIQKGIETIGGAVVGGIGQLTPGDFMGYEKNLDEVIKERGDRYGFWDMAGQFQAHAEAFRRTDMPSVDLSLPGQGIPLPGGKRFDDFQLGVKGAIELLPDAAITVATGGASAAGSVLRKTALVGARTVGADVLYSGGKAAVRAAKGIPAATENVAAVARSIPVLSMAKTGDVAVENSHNPKFRERIDKLPGAFKGTITGMWNRINPATLIDPSRRAQRALLSYTNTIDQVEASSEVVLAELVDRIGGYQNLPDVPDTRVLASADIGQQGRSWFNKLRNIRKGQTNNSAFSIGEGGVITGTGIKTIDRKAWTEVFENFFDGRSRNKVRESEFGDLDIGKYDEELRMYVGGDEKAAQTATFIRHYQDLITDLTDHFENASGKKILRTDKLDSPGAKYIPRLPNGGELFDEAHKFNLSIGSQPGRTPRPLKERSLTNELMQEAIDRGEYSLAGPMETLREHARVMYKASVDAEYTKRLKVLAHKGEETGVIDINRAQNRITGVAVALKAGKSIRPSTIQKIRDDGFNQIADKVEEVLSTTNVKKKQSLLNKFEDTKKSDMAVVRNQYYSVGQYGKNVPPAYAGLLFENAADAKRIAAAHNLTPQGAKEAITEWTAKVGDVIRLGRTGFDFGYWLIQGLPTAGLIAGRFAAGHPKQAAELAKAWGKSVGTGFDAFVRPERLMKTLMKDADVTKEAIENGMQLSKAATDVFQAVQQRTLLHGIPVVGKALDEVVSDLAKSFERAFVAPGDYIRLEYYKVLRNTAAKKPGGLQELTSTLNKMTGALSSNAAGITRTQQQIERGFLFFSPRYTRASMALIADVYKGGLQGELARQSMVGMLGLGMATYIAYTQVMGQEAHLDPSDGKFMTVKIGDDRVGIGGFWTQFAKTTARISETAWDEDARQTFTGEDWRRNPILRWIRSRSAPGAGVGWDLAVGEDFMGRAIEGPADFTKHVGTQLSPIWLENALLAEPYKTGLVGNVGEVFGGRVRPLSAAERRRELRDALAVDSYGKEWHDLNGLQQKKIRSGSAPNVSNMDIVNLAELEELALSQRALTGEEQDNNIEKYYLKIEEINDEWMGNVGPGIDFLNAGQIDPGRFKDLYLSSANAIRRAKMEEANDPEGDYKLALEYFSELTEEFGEDHPEDVAYAQYIADIIATDAFDDPEGFDFRRRNEAINSFKLKWGEDVYAYVQERFQEGREIPAIVIEFWKGRERFEYYWSSVEEESLAAIPNSNKARDDYYRWLESTDNEKDNMEDHRHPLYSRELVRLLKTMRQVKLSLREQDKLLDAWLFRWGYTDTLRHPENALAPEGFDDARDYWRNPDPIPLDQFGIQSGIAI